MFIACMINLSTACNQFVEDGKARYLLFTGCVKKGPFKNRPHWYDLNAFQLCVYAKPQCVKY